MRESPVVYLAVGIMACGPGASPRISIEAGDSAFTGVQTRGGIRMSRRAAPASAPVANTAAASR